MIYEVHNTLYKAIQEAQVQLHQVVQDRMDFANDIAKDIELQHTQEHLESNIAALTEMLKNVASVSCDTNPVLN